MKSHFDVVIAGGGMVGATLACALGGSGLKVAVIEPQVAPETTKDYGLRVSAIAPASQTVFENLGVWDGMQARRAAPVEAMRIWEDNSVLTYDSADIGEPCLAWIIENQAMVTALTERLRQHGNIEWLSPARLEQVEIDEDTVRIHTDNGRALQTRLLVGADGAASRVRAAAGIDWSRHDLGQSAIVAVVQTGRPHGRTAFQHFLPTGPLAFLPLDDPHKVSIVWSADTGRAAALMALDENGFNAELQTAFGDSLGTVALASARAAIPLALGFAEAYTRHRIALVGDAAHTVHPLAGQGVNLGILDAAMLAEVLLTAHAASRDPGRAGVLRRYERARKGANLGMQVVTGGFRYLFGGQASGLRGLRNLGFQLTEQLQPVKNYFMRRASGLTGERPRLAQRVQR